METWKKVSQYLPYLSGSLGAITAVLGYLLGNEGLPMQIIAITGTALFLGSVVHFLGERQRTATIYDDRGRIRKLPFPVWSKLVLAAIALLWLLCIAWLVIVKVLSSISRPTDTSCSVSLGIPAPSATPIPDDRSQIELLIGTEAEAVLYRDLDRVMALFREDTIIIDAHSGRQWVGCDSIMDRYNSIMSAVGWNVLTGTQDLYLWRIT